MLPALTIAAAAAGLGPPRLDLSSQVPSALPVAARTDGVCVDREDTVLATAVVIYGRRPGRSAWGHISLRFLACQGGRFRDVEYEATRVDDTLREWYHAAFPDERWYDALDFLDLQHDRLVLYRNDDPIDGGSYREELDKNREITELWMPWTGAPAWAVLADLDHDYALQMAAFRAGRTVDRTRYRALSTNCTAPVRRAEATLSTEVETPDSIFPMVYLRQLADHPDVRVVVHPSPHVLRRIQADTGDLKAAWSGAPTRVYRPLIRGTLHEDTLDAFRARVSEGAVPLAIDWFVATGTTSRSSAAGSPPRGVSGD